MKTTETAILAVLVIFSLVAAPAVFGDDFGWTDDWDNGWTDGSDSGWTDGWDSGWEDGWDNGWDGDGDDSDFDDWDDDSGFDDWDDDDWDDGDDVWEIAPEILGLNVLVTPVTQVLVVNLANHERDLNEDDVLTWEVTPDSDSTSIFKTDLDGKILTITPHKLGETYITLKLTDSTGLYDTKRTLVKIIRPDYDETAEEEEEKESAGIFVSSIRINADSIAGDSQVEAFITIQNSGSEDLENVNIAMVIQELAARGVAGNFDMDSSDRVTKRIWLEVEDASQIKSGTYYTRFTINSDKARRVVYREADLLVE